MRHELDSELVKKGHPDPGRCGPWEGREEAKWMELCHFPDGVRTWSPSSVRDALSGLRRPEKTTEMLPGLAAPALHGGMTGDANEERVLLCNLTVLER